MRSPTQSPLCPPLAAPVHVATEEAFVVSPAIDAARARELADKVILASVLRPSDIAGANIEPPVLVYLPFWRVHATVDGFHIGIATGRGADGGLKWILPTGGARHRDAVLLVCARRNFAYGPTMVEVPGTLAMANGMPAFRVLEINLEEMTPHASFTIPEGEIVQPDVSRATAEQEAMARIRRAVQPASAIYSKYEPKVRATAFCQYPLYVVRYHYDGHAKRHPGEEFYVTLSARTEKVVGSRHPSPWKALARKFRKLITL